MNNHSAFVDLIGEMSKIYQVIDDDSSKISTSFKSAIHLVESVTENVNNNTDNYDATDGFVLTDEMAEDIAEEATEFGIRYILENFTQEDIQEKGSGIYQLVTDAVYQFIKDEIGDLIYPWDPGCDTSNHVYQMVAWSQVWEGIDMVLAASLTMEEKLREVGMSVKDFI